MRTLFPSAAACFVVAFVASIGYAETQLESAGESTSDAVAVSKPDTAKPDIKKTEASRPELSVAPLTHITYPDDRPSWILSEPDLQSPVQTWVVTTSGSESIQQCEAELEALMPAAVSLYIKETTGWGCDDEFLEKSWIDDQLVARRYVGTFQQGDRELHEIAVELNFNSSSRKRILLAQQNIVVNERLQATGGLFALGLIGLCCTGGLLGLVSRRYA